MHKRSRLVAWLLLAGVTACAAPRPTSPPDASPPVGELDLSRVRLVDLSYTYDDETLFWPTSPTAFELTELAYGPAAGGYFYAAYSFSTPEHGGTHLDAPIHFAENGATVAEIPLDQLVAPGVVIDVSDQTAGTPDYRATAADILGWESAYGDVPAGAIVLLRTGWSDRWPDAAAYLGNDTPGDASNLHFPGYGDDAARLLVDDRRVAALGIDTASIDHGPSTDFVVHQIAAAAGVVALENVADLRDVPATGAWIVALPVKIGVGSGAPARIVAMVPE